MTDVFENYSTSDGEDHGSFTIRAYEHSNIIGDKRTFIFEVSDELTDVEVDEILQIVRGVRGVTNAERFVQDRTVAELQRERQIRSEIREALQRFIEDNL